MDAKNKSNHILKHLETLKLIPSTTIDRFSNEKIIYSYVDNDNNEGNEVIDITQTVSIVNLLLYRNDYLAAVTNESDTAGGLFDKIKHRIMEISQTEDKNIANDYTPLLCVIKENAMWQVFNHESYALDTITIRDIISIYNDIDKHCCKWLENLIADNLIPAGVVDCRDIKEIKPEEVSQYTQLHFFAGTSS